jgi:hypothetical protein
MNVLFNFNTADAGRPSFFEMYIQSQMMPSLRPAMKYILAIVSQKFPQLAVTHKYADEIFYGLLWVLEHHFLRHYDGSFSENFYGLKRAHVVEDEGKPSPFLKADRRLSLFFLVAVPYLKDKLDQWYNNNIGHNVSALQAGDVERFRGPTTNTHPFRSRLLILMRFLYPAFHACYEGLHFTYQVLYMYEYTSYFTPFLHLLGLNIKRLSMKDIQLQTHRAYLRNRVHTGDHALIRAFWKLLDMGGKAVDFTKYLLPLAIFFFKFLEWWYADNNKAMVTQQEPIPPPPTPPSVAPGGALSLPPDRSHCPICKKPRVNPTMIPSGFVFCYTCVHPYVQEHGICPITKMPTSVERLRRIFDES